MTRVPALEDLRRSLWLLLSVALLALALLGSEGNWPKILRVSLAALAYTLALLLSARRVLRPDGEVGFAAFALAGGLAGIVSGLVRPAVDRGVLVAGTLGAAGLLGGVHCWGLRSVRRQLGRGGAP